jgi:hypothetical protein
MATTDTTPDTDKTKVEVTACLVLRAPHWFARDDFLDWRQGKGAGRGCAPACWQPDVRTGEYGDVFMTFDRSLDRPGLGQLGDEHAWEGSDADGLPDDIYRTIGFMLYERGLRAGVIWIMPV